MLVVVGWRKGEGEKGEEREEDRRFVFVEREGARRLRQPFSIC